MEIYNLSFVTNFVILLINLIEINGDVIVETKNGKIRGTTVDALNRTVNQFLGIRYAEPPIGSLRFKKPLPVKSWNGIHNATKYGYRCVQKPKGVTPHLHEDCLFLNVITPVIDSEIDDLKPVMFWIHGGTFLTGSGSISPELATYDVVLVGINYRLGPFGFVYGGTDEAPGNVGFWDMALALEWVKENIKSFGGNPEDITIFGQSAGSQSVGHLIISPITRNKYKRAIMESGGPCYYTGKGTADKSLNLQDAKKFAKQMGCDDDGQWLECLKHVNVEKILNYNSSLYIDRPIIGDEFNPEAAQRVLKSGHFKTGTELLIGVNANEGSTYGTGIDPKLINIENNITKESLHDIVMNLNSVLHKRLTPEIDVQNVYDFYLRNASESDQLQLRRTFGQIFGDFIITCPTHYFAHNHALWSDTNTVYFYKLTYKSVKPPDRCAPWMGVCHGNDIPYVFGYPFRNHDPAYHEEDYQLSRLIMHLWTTFAKTGNPLSHSVPFPNDINLTGVDLKSVLWPSFRSTVHGPVVPKVMTLHPKDFGHILTEPLKANCDGLWKPYFL